MDIEGICSGSFEQVGQNLLALGQGEGVSVADKSQTLQRAGRARRARKRRPSLARGSTRPTYLSVLYFCIMEFLHGVHCITPVIDEYFEWIRRGHCCSFLVRCDVKFVGFFVFKTLTFVASVLEFLLTLFILLFLSLYSLQASPTMVSIGKSSDRIFEQN